MKETIKNAWEWIKEHKKEIAIAACTGVMAIGGTILFKNCKEAAAIRKALSTVKDCARPEKVNIIDLGVGKLDDALRYSDGTVELWLDNVPLADMGTLGDAITAQIPGIPGDNNVWALLSVKPNSIG